MDLEFSAEDQTFRAEVREFLATSLPEGLRRKVENGVELQRDDIMSWHRILHAKGWAAPSRPSRRQAALCKLMPAVERELHSTISCWRLARLCPVCHKRQPHVYNTTQTGQTG